jgi:hypothetical protein
MRMDRRWLETKVSLIMGSSTMMFERVKIICYAKRWLLESKMGRKSFTKF